MKVHNKTCPVCGSGNISHFDSVDFNKNCNEKLNNIELSGIQVDYIICDDCDFLYADAICSWDKKQFEEKIYNKDYINYDPDYIDTRPRENFKFLTTHFSDFRKDIQHLDYGGGNGKLSGLLKNAGIDSESFEPFSNSQDLPIRKFNLITAFEVFEHVPNPNDIMRNITRLIGDEGVVIFTTSLTDGQVTRGNKLDWWYASPRNGHICLYSKKSLNILAERYNLKFETLRNGQHILWNKLPKFANRYLKFNSNNYAIHFIYKILTKYLRRKST